MFTKTTRTVDSIVAGISKNIIQLRDLAESLYNREAVLEERATELQREASRLGDEAERAEGVADKFAALIE